MSHLVCSSTEPFVRQAGADQFLIHPINIHAKRSGFNEDTLPNIRKERIVKVKISAKPDAFFGNGPNLETTRRM